MREVWGGCRGPVLAAVTVLSLSSVLSLGGCAPGGDGEGSGDVTLTVVATNYGDGIVKNSESYWDRVDTAFEAINPGIRIDLAVTTAMTTAAAA